jgi:hypothetical protein
LLGLRRVLRLRAEGRAIPPPGGETAASVRRWSTFVAPGLSASLAAGAG